MLGLRDSAPSNLRETVELSSALRAGRRGRTSSWSSTGLRGQAHAGKGRRGLPLGREAFQALLMQAERRKATAALAAAGKDMRRAARADGKVWHSRRNSTPLLLALLAMLLCSAPAVASREPNIVFILADDLGYNDVSLHGGSAWATPHIDSMARDGLELRSYYVQPVCSPSRASLLTGRHVIHTGVYIALNSGMPPFPYLSIELKLLPSYLPKHKSFLIGKWHLGFNTPQCLPLNRGFSSFSPGYINSAQDYFTHTINGNYDMWDEGVWRLSSTGLTGLRCTRAGPCRFYAPTTRAPTRPFSSFSLCRPCTALTSARPTRRTGRAAWP